MIHIANILGSVLMMSLAVSEQLPLLISNAVWLS
jgi:hypothetical protein